MPEWQLTWPKWEVILEVKKEQRKVHFATLMCISSQKMRSWNRSIRSTKARSCSEVTFWKTTQAHTRYSQSKARLSHEWRPPKVMDVIARPPGCAGQAADAISAYTQVEKEDAPPLFEKSEVRMSRHWDTSTTTQVAQIMVQHGRSSRSFWTKSVRSSFGRTVMGKAIWENPIATRLGEGFQLGMLIRTPSKKVILVCACRWHQIGWKETKHWSDVESTQ